MYTKKLSFILLLLFAGFMVAFGFACSKKGNTTATGNLENFEDLTLWLKNEDGRVRIHVAPDTSLIGKGLSTKNYSQSKSDGWNKFYTPPSEGIIYLSYDPSAKYEVSGTQIGGHLYADTIQSISNTNYSPIQQQPWPITFGNHVLPDNNKYLGTISVGSRIITNPNSAGDSIYSVQVLEFRSGKNTYTFHISAADTIFPGFEGADKNGWMKGFLKIDSDHPYEVNGVLVDNNLFATSIQKSADQSYDYDTVAIIGDSFYWDLIVGRTSNK